MPKIVLMTVTNRRLIKGYGLRSYMQEALSTNTPFVDITVHEDTIENGPVIVTDISRTEVESFIQKEGPRGNYIRIATWANVSSKFILYCPDNVAVIYDRIKNTLSVNGAIIEGVLSEPQYKTIAKNHKASLQHCGLTLHDAGTLRILRALYAGEDSLLCQYGSSNIKDYTDDSRIVRIDTNGQITSSNPNTYPKGMIMPADLSVNETKQSETPVDRDALIEELVGAGHKRAKLKKFDDAELAELYDQEFNEEDDDEPATERRVHIKRPVQLKKMEQELLEASDYTQEEVSNMTDAELKEAHAEYTDDSGEIKSAPEPTLDDLTAELRLLLAAVGVNRKHLLVADLKALLATTIEVIEDHLLDNSESDDDDD